MIGAQADRLLQQFDRGDFFTLRQGLAVAQLALLFLPAQFQLNAVQCRTRRGQITFEDDALIEHRLALRVELLDRAVAVQQLIGDFLDTLGKLAALLLETFDGLREAGQCGLLRLNRQRHPVQRFRSVTDLQTRIVTACSELTALSRVSGAEVWKNEFLKNRDISGPTAWQNSVVVGDFEGYVHFFDAATGEPQARVRAGRDRVTSPPLAVNDMVVVQTDGGDLAAFRQITR